MADKPGCLLVFTPGQMFVVSAKLPDELLQLLSLWVLLHLHNSPVRTIEVRVPSANTLIDKRRIVRVTPVCHCPVEEVVHGADILVKVLS